MAVGYLTWDGCELINDARFLANIGNSSCIDASFTYADECCPVLALDGECGTWDPIDMSGIEDSPWYNAADARSTRFLGFWLLDISGLDASVWKVGSRRRGTPFGGSNFTRNLPSHRTLGYRVLMAACDEGGLEYGLRWLENSLIHHCECEGGGCENCEISVRSSCADVSVPDEGLYYIRGVRVTDGLRWGPRLFDGRWSDLPTQFREVTFALSAGDPCLYGCVNDLVALQDIPWPGGLPACLEMDDWWCNPAYDAALCGIVPAPSVGTNAPILEIRAGPDGAPGFLIEGYNDAAGHTCSDPNLPEADLCGSFRTLPLAPNEIMVIDNATHSVTLGTNTRTPIARFDRIYVEDGSPFDWIENQSCDPMLIRITPLGLCHSNVSPTSVKMEWLHREGCL